MRINQNKFICQNCFDVSHAKCLNLQPSQNDTRTPNYFTCTSCFTSVLPFHNRRSLDDTFDDPIVSVDTHENILQEKRNLLKILHLNKQSLVSSFNEFRLLLDRYTFDIIAMSETWLKDNAHLLDYIQIPGYTFEYLNRDKVKGGGVGCYINEQLTYKRRKDIESLADIEHLWL